MKIVDYIVKIECSNEGHLCYFYPSFIGDEWITSNIFKAHIYESKKEAKNAIISDRKYWTYDLEKNYGVIVIGASVVKRTIKYEDVL